MFLWEYLKHPRAVGALAPSSRRLAETMMEPLDFRRAEVIVEYGPGTGAFTELLLARKRPETRLILIEQNPAFFRRLFSRYHGRENTTVQYGSAENAVRLLQECGVQKADAVVSGLPFTSLPQEVTLRVFAATKRLLGEEGIFVTFQYSRVKESLFSRYFSIQNVLQEKNNLPPAYVYVMKNGGRRRLCSASIITL